MTLKTTSAQRDEIVCRYIAGESSVQLAVAFGITQTSVRQLLARRNVPRRQNTPELHQKYTCNHNYFSEPLDEERAYWIGFLLADGYVTKPRVHNTPTHRRGSAPTVGLDLSTVDVKHVERFRDALQSNHPIKCRVNSSEYSKGRHSLARLVINSQLLADALARYGVVPNKTAICVAPELPAQLRRHMYRGYFDGDGGLCIHQIRKWPSASLDIIGTTAFLRTMAEWLELNAGANPHKPLASSLSKVVDHLRYGGMRQVSDILHLLYDDATIYLNRKYITAQQIFALADANGSHRRHDHFPANNQQT
jgi:hypothetical protein